MSNTTITKVDSKYSPAGKMGQKYLAAGVQVGMRLWCEEPGEEKEETSREYETVGYVIEGAAELYIAGQMVRLETGDSWVVPRRAMHRYRIVAPFSAVEATSPPAFVHGRDEARTNSGGADMTERALYDV
ncbi:MAG TPA: cupin domain-containing protein [Pirellulales bacterium]|nr:cupin domain-containing protein [Pirellulales bacterium]